MTRRCEARGCAGPIHSSGLCDAHRKQRARRPSAHLTPLRARTAAPPGAVSYVGLMLLPATVRAVDAAAARAQKSPRYVVARAVDGWASGRAWSPRRAPGRAAASAMVALAACLNLFCAGQLGAARPDAVALTKPMPPKPFPGQPVGPSCPEYMELREGACWLPFRLPSGQQLRGCRESEALYEDKDGYCWTPGTPIRRKAPSSVEP